MKKCELIATLPAINNMQKIIDIFSNPFISEVRYNTGGLSPYTPEVTITKLKQLSEKYDKRLWIDLKGRQLRVAKWADPKFECITLNHKINVSLPAVLYLRNGEGCNITNVINGNEVYVDPLPRHAVGAGQSVNIISRNLKIDGYLTPKDVEYLNLCVKHNIRNVMASFVEDFDDIAEILRIIPQANIILKIESNKGMDLVNSHNHGASLMAARDDLYIQTGLDMITHLKSIIEKDKNAICASRIFLSLEHNDRPDFCDFEDLEYMYALGYRRFMLCDNVCNYAFDRAIEAWRQWIFSPVIN